MYEKIQKWLTSKFYLTVKQKKCSPTIRKYHNCITIQNIMKYFILLHDMVKISCLRQLKTYAFKHTVFDMAQPVYSDLNIY